MNITLVLMWWEFYLHITPTLIGERDEFLLCAYKQWDILWGFEQMNYLNVVKSTNM